MKRRGVLWLALVLGALAIAAVMLGNRPAGESRSPSGRAESGTTEIQLDVDTDCNPVRGVCSAQAEGLTLRISLGPDVRGLQPFPVRVEIEGAGSTAVTDVELAFNMSEMDMGRNRYRLQSSDGRTWSAAVTLPICSSGRVDWYVDVHAYTPTAHYSGRFPFPLAP